MMDERERLVVVRLVEAMTLLLGEDPKWVQILHALFEAAKEADVLTDQPMRTG